MTRFPTNIQSILLIPRISLQIECNFNSFSETAFEQAEMFAFRPVFLQHVVRPSAILWSNKDRFFSLPPRFRPQSLSQLSAWVMEKEYFLLILANSFSIHGGPWGQWLLAAPSPQHVVHCLLPLPTLF